MKKQKLKIYWPNNIVSIAENGDNWFLLAKKAGMNIPTGCLTGSCGACEIDVNGETIRPCVTNIEFYKNPHLNIELTTDPFWD